ncbi:CAP domain-containing protein, partial [Longispora fulva]|uniref:CAP domain-containing protein n=2 Tax=Bacteria TaxID=2 RepID=UPI0036425B63
MKNLTYMVWLMAVTVISLTSCSKDSIEDLDSADLTTAVTPVSYSDLELDVLDLVNAYRVQQGLSELQPVNEGSIQAANHNDHMISNNEVCHD